ncbi:hypothetical protein [Yoonia vestfoldensis]|uniref:hypothetical protein n=1 Tax=Yoonia vestfoldensis TaxID=245188 RepID=UPI00037495ED|nr:hypothetical protein [Yoonia vestfoldensis]
MAQPPARLSPYEDRTPHHRGRDLPGVPADADGKTQGALPHAPMAFAPQDLTTAGLADRSGLLWRLWGAIAQRAGL